MRGQRRRRRGNRALAWMPERRLQYECWRVTRLLPWLCHPACSPGPSGRPLLGWEMSGGQGAGAEQGPLSQLGAVPESSAAASAHTSPPPIRWPWFSPTTPPQRGLTELSTQIQVLGPLPGPLWLLYFQPTPPVTPCPSNTVNVLEPIFDLPCPGRVMVGLPPPHPGPSVGPSLKSGKENDRFPHNLGTQGALHGNPGRAGTCV